jgi:hypothetical protein
VQHAAESCEGRENQEAQRKETTEAAAKSRETEWAKAGRKDLIAKEYQPGETEAKCDRVANCVELVESGKNPTDATAEGAKDNPSRNEDGCSGGTLRH